MTAPFIIPFNFMPASNPSRRTSAYTLPVGNYALVEAISGDLTIAGVSVFHTRSVVLSSSGSAATFLLKPSGTCYMSYTGTYTRNSDGGAISCIGSVADSAAPLESFSKTGSQAGTYNLTTTTTRMETLTFTLNATSGVGSGALTLNATVYFSERNSFWISPGTVLTGSNYVVTEYAKIS